MGKRVPDSVQEQRDAALDATAELILRDISVSSDGTMASAFAQVPIKMIDGDEDEDLDDEDDEFLEDEDDEFFDDDDEEDEDDGFGDDEEDDDDEP